MQIPLQITFEGGLPSSDALRARIEREAEKLERFHDGIIGCRVAVIGRPHRRRRSCSRRRAALKASRTVTKASSWA